MNKKAYLYTAGIIMFSLVILNLSVTIAQFEKSSSKGVSNLITLDRVNNRFSSIEFTIRKIFSTSGIRIETGSDFVSFIEDLPNTKDTDFKNQMTAYKIYIESESLEESDLNQEKYGTIIPESIDNVPLVILPSDVLYTHQSFGSNIITIEANNKVLGLDFVIDLSAFTVIDLQSSTTPGSIPLYVKASETQTLNINIDINESNTITIVTQDNGNIVITINNGRINIDNTLINTPSVSINSTIRFVSGKYYVGLDDAVDVTVRGATKFSSPIIT